MLLTVAFVLLLVRQFVGVGARVGWVLQLIAAVGLLITVVGIVGLVVGGRRKE
jgi:hypothetical protein